MGKKTGLEHLQKFEESTDSPILCLKCPAHKDKVEIKCMGSVGGKTPTEPKIYSSLTFGTWDKIKLML